MLLARLTLLLCLLFAIGDLRAEDAPRATRETARQYAHGFERTFPKPLSEHPGNIFVAGEEVVASLPAEWSGPWRVVDYDGKQVAEGQATGKINLGRLPTNKEQKVTATNGTV